MTAERVQRLVNAVDWPPASVMQRSVSTWPCYNVLADLGAPSLTMCDACWRNQVHAKIILYGQPYNPTTLDGTSIPDINTQKVRSTCYMMDKIFINRISQFQFTGIFLKRSQTYNISQFILYFLFFVNSVKYRLNKVFCFCSSDFSYLNPWRDLSSI